MGFAPGGNSDTMPRLIRPRMSAFLGTTIVVENRAGAGGALAAGVVAASPADGHTLLFDALATSELSSASQSKNRIVSYNPARVRMRGRTAAAEPVCAMLTYSSSSACAEARSDVAGQITAP